jgi:hypothetical protein
MCKPDGTGTIGVDVDLVDALRITAISQLGIACSSFDHHYGGFAGADESWRDLPSRFEDVARRLEAVRLIGTTQGDPVEALPTDIVAMLAHDAARDIGEDIQEELSTPATHDMLVAVAELAQRGIRLLDLAHQAGYRPEPGEDVAS